MPKLGTRTPRETLLEVRRKVGAARRLLLTCPDPGAPRSKLLNKTMRAGVGVIDRLLDKLTARQAG